jgi:23S rRNA (adenine-N6)-dimethyltransferase
MARSSESTLWRTQNFLRDRRLAKRLVSRAKIGPGDVVYDLGAGGGVLTEALARLAARVIAVERDPELVARLRARFRSRANVEIRHADILTYQLPQANYVVFASPPFDSTSATVRKLTTTDVPPRDAYLMLQREAANRYSGRPRQTLAAVLIAPWFSLRITHRFARFDFAPVPGVDVVMVRMHKRGPPLIAPRDAQPYRDLVVALFISRKPSIGASASHLFGGRVSRRLLHDAQIDPASSPSLIPLGAWLRLFGHFARLPSTIRGSILGSEQRLRRRQQRLEKIHRTRVPRDALSVNAADIAHREYPLLRAGDRQSAGATARVATHCGLGVDEVS